MKVGFIGLGSIGLPLASSILKAGHTLVVHDLDRSRAESLLEDGATWSASVAGVCDGADIVITSLPGPEQVKSVFNGIADNLHAGQTWIEMSTTDEIQLREFAEIIGKSQVNMLEATVTGGVDNAWTGNLTLLVAGDPGVQAQCQPVLDAVASKVIYIGDLGQATIAKLITNMLAFIHEGALAEALMLGHAAGLDPDRLLQGIQASYGGSFVADVDGPKAIKGNYRCDFTLQLARKDMRLTEELAERVGVELDWGSLTSNQLDRLINTYGSQGDVLSVFRNTIDPEKER